MSVIGWEKRVCLNDILDHAKKDINMNALLLKRSLPTQAKK